MVRRAERGRGQRRALGVPARASAATAAPPVDFEADCLEVSGAEVPAPAACQAPSRLPQGSLWPPTWAGRPTVTAVSMAAAQALAATEAPGGSRQARELVATLYASCAQLDRVLAAVCPDPGALVAAWVEQDRSFMGLLAPLLRGGRYGPLRRAAWADGTYLGGLDPTRRPAGWGVLYQTEQRWLRGRWQAGAPMQGCELRLGTCTYYGALDDHLCRHGRGMVAWSGTEHLIGRWRRDRLVPDDCRMQLANGGRFRGRLDGESRLLSGEGELRLADGAVLVARFVEGLAVGAGLYTFPANHRLANCRYQGPVSAELRPHGSGTLQVVRRAPAGQGQPRQLPCRFDQGVTVATTAAVARLAAGDSL